MKHSKKKKEEKKRILQKVEIMNPPSRNVQSLVVTGLMARTDFARDFKLTFCCFYIKIMSRFYTLLSIQHAHYLMHFVPIHISI